MKNLHKKIIAGALIGAISMGGVLSQGAKVFADSFDDIKEPMHLEENEKFWSHEYMKILSEYFNFEMKKIDFKEGIKIDKFLRNGGELAQDLLDYGMKKEKVCYYWIGGWYYEIKFRKVIKPVSVFNQWEDGLPRFFDYFYEHIKD